MAFAGDAVSEAEPAEVEVAIKKSRRTISDYLGDSDGDGHGQEVASPPPPETPPRLRLPRFTCARLRFGRLGRKKRRGVAGGEKSQDQDESYDSSGRRRPAEASGGAAAEAGMGMGLSMLLLLARTCVELNRMAEVRAQMEALLEEIREEAGKMKSAGHVVVVRPRPNNLQPSSSTTTASSSCTSDTHTNCHAATSSRPAMEDEEGRARIAALEVEDDELEAEHARRGPLEWKCSTEEDTFASSSDDEFIELEGGRFTGGDLARDAGVDDAGDADADDGSEYEEDERRGAWDAVELERRLHELRHQRDAERIEELEAALRRAELKVTEKEMEARLWQDTAALALRPPPPPPRDGQ
ncbi:hypothetical protein ACP4OV_009814 [Aristida adscensionis]